MKASCIIPTRDRRRMVCEAIDSVLVQQGCDLELVVVDDGSSDGTWEELRSRYPQAVLVQAGGIGCGPARNLGAEAAAGDVLMFLDSDDLWLPGHARTLLDQFESGYRVAYGVTRTVDQVSAEEFDVPGPGEGRSGDCFSALVRWCFLNPSSAAITRAAHARVGGCEPGTIGEDWTYFLKLAARYPFGFTPKVITRRRLHAGSMCRPGDARAAVLEALGRVERTLQAIGRTREEDRGHIRALQRHAQEEGDTWRTVQQWYQSLRRHGLL